MNIAQVIPTEDYKLVIYSEDGQKGIFDVNPYLDSEAFLDLKKISEFQKIHNKKYFVEWECGADLSADTIEAEWEPA